ncbi:MAG: hypothetical protein IIA49_01630 [Bacteroidetes bacterium]|nr:hypothetical protein [Bacteroidota bacterium]
MSLISLYVNASSRLSRENLLMQWETKINQFNIIVTRFFPAYRTGRLNNNFNYLKSPSEIRS